MDTIITTGDDVSLIRTVEAEATENIISYEAGGIVDIVLQDAQTGQVVTQCEDGKAGVVESIAIGPQGAPGGIGYLLRAGEAIGGHRAVAVDADGKAVYADCRNIEHAKRVVGITVGAADEGRTVRVIGQGEIEEISWNWNTAFPIYLGENGTLQQSPAVNGFSLIVGFPVGNKKMVVSIGEPIILLN